MEEDIIESTGIEHIEEVKCNVDKPNSKRSYKQIYRKDWESNPIFKGIFFSKFTIIFANIPIKMVEFSGWLSPVPCDKHKAECTACNKELLAHRLTLLKHASSAKHLKRVSMTDDSTSRKIFVV